MTSILTINGGSSSIKFAHYKVSEPLERLMYGKIDRIGRPETHLTFCDPIHNRKETRGFMAADDASVANALLDWLEEQGGFSTIRAVGHRVVHGMHRTAPERITRELLDGLHRLSETAPEHMPRALELIEAFLRRHPTIPQVACFDTAFHQTMPRVARLLAIPRRYEAMGIQRYGFHGLAYSFLMEELTQLGDGTGMKGRVILAHLGSGCSLAAVRDGASVDTSMGFSPASGVLMGTRCGDLDPGVVGYLARTEQMTSDQFYRMVNEECGLLGISETSADIHDLLAVEAGDPRAAEAIGLFCYQIKKAIGSFSAVLGGVDTLVFSGGIGENEPSIRTRICDGLGFLGIELSPSRNAETTAVISTDSSRATVRVIRANEERMIARSVLRSGLATTQTDML